MLAYDPCRVLSATIPLEVLVSFRKYPKVSRSSSCSEASCIAADSPGADYPRAPGGIESYRLVRSGEALHRARPLRDTLTQRMLPTERPAAGRRRPGAPARLAAAAAFAAGWICLARFLSASPGETH